MKYMANVGAGILLRKKLSTNVSVCWSQFKSNIWEWEIDWGLIKAKENQQVSQVHFQDQVWMQRVLFFSAQFLVH